MNIYWLALAAPQQLQERTIGWFEATVSTAAYNCHNTNVSNHQGDVDIIARNQLVHRSQVYDYDKLGRWMMVMVIIRGKDCIHLRVIAAYRPHAIMGTCTVYQQQV